MLHFVAGGCEGQAALVRTPPSGGLCLLCGKKFTSFGNANRHFKEKHGDSNGRHHVCHLCGSGFTLLRYLLNHQRIVHGLTADKARGINPQQAVNVAAAVADPLVLAGKN